jgi:hypothetical protein
METYRLGIKFFVAEPGPESIGLQDFIPVFHTWIQKQILKDHLLIDVHDYSHIRQGPGILLVAHEGNFSMDSAEGRLGLLYQRKQPASGSNEERLVSVLKTALQACRLLEEEPALQGRVRFRKNELLLIANDRLNAPNDDETLSRVLPAVSVALNAAFGHSDFDVTRISTDAKDRLTIRVQPRSGDRV